MTELKCYNLKSLAGLYAVDVRTLKKMLKEKQIDVKPVGNIYTVKDVEQIFTALGVPGKKSIN
jgi:deoxyribose-phosphate aldolase